MEARDHHQQAYPGYLSHTGLVMGEGSFDPNSSLGADPFIRSTPTPSFASDHYPVSAIHSYTGVVNVSAAPVVHPSVAAGVVGGSVGNGYYNNSNPFQTQSHQNYYAMQQQQHQMALQQWIAQYQQWYHYVEHQRKERERQNLPPDQRIRLTPLHFPHRHSRVSFGATNQLIVIRGSNVIIQQIDPSLMDYGEDVSVTTWPGPLIKGETNKDDVLEYIRTLESSLKHKTPGMMHTLSASSSNLDELDSVSLQNPEAYFKFHERRQLWSLLSMAVRQNGVVSGADISELLLANNESDFESPEEGDDVGRVRRFLTLGQKKTALEYAQKTGLWGHVSALILFNTLLGSSPSSESLLATQMSSMVSKFINSTLSRDDALFVLYRCLLTKLQSRNKSQVDNNKHVTTENLQQFAILVANDCEVSPGVSSYGRSSELLKLMVCMRNQTHQHLINLGNLDVPEGPSSSSSSVLSVKYTDELVFLNEIWEFARNQTEFIEVLIPFKAILAAKLFDFGLIAQATKYCYALRQYFTYYHLYFAGKSVTKDSCLDWESLMNLVTDIECRIYGFDVTSSSSAKKPVEPSPIKTVLDDSKETDANLRDDEVEIKASDKKDNREEDSSGEEDDEGKEIVSEGILSNKTDPKQRPQGPQRKESDNKQAPRPTPSSGMTRIRSESASSMSGRANPFQHHPGQRRRTLSREDSQETTSPSPPDSPVKSQKQQHYNPVPAFETMSLKNTSPLNFVTTSMPLMSLPGDSLGHQSQHQVFSEGGTIDEESLEEDSRRDSFGSPLQEPFSSTQRNIPLNTSSDPSAPFEAVFSPITSPEPFNMQSPNNAVFMTNNGSVARNSQSEVTPGKETEDNQEDRESTEKAGNKNKGWLGSLFNRTPKANLPDDSNPSIVYDEKLKMWVDKTDPSSVTQAKTVLQGPPKGPFPGSQTSNGMHSSQPTSRPALSSSLPPPLPVPSSSSSITANNLKTNNTFNFVSRGPNTKKRPQYVDVWQQTQKKN